MSWFPGLRAEASAPTGPSHLPETVQWGISYAEHSFTPFSTQKLSSESPKVRLPTQPPIFYTAPALQHQPYGPPITKVKHTPTSPKREDIRCYAHGCAGRRFSSLGNYRRHLKEQNGWAKMFTCETCRKTFTRSTAKNEHQKLHQKEPSMLESGAIPTSLLEVDIGPILDHEIENSAYFPPATDHTPPHQWLPQNQSPLSTPEQCGVPIYASEIADSAYFPLATEYTPQLQWSQQSQFQC